MRVLEFSGSVGEAAMIRAGAAAARGELLLTVPCPLEVELEGVPAMLERVHAGAQMVVATRAAAEGGRSAVLQSRLFNRVLSWLGGMEVRDVASGTRLLQREVLEDIPVYGDFHRYLPILAARAGFRVEEVVARQRAGTHRPVVHRPATYLWRAIDLVTVLFISRFTRMPLRLFGSVGSAFLAVGVVLLAVLGVERLLGTPLGNRPILVLATLLVGLGVQLFTIGLLGELLLFFSARSLRDYRVAEVWEEGRPVTPHPGDPGASPPGDAPAASPPRTADTKAPR